MTDDASRRSGIRDSVASVTFREWVAWSETCCGTNKCPHSAKYERKGKFQVTRSASSKHTEIVAAFPAIAYAYEVFQDQPAYARENHDRRHGSPDHDITSGSDTGRWHSRPREACSSTRADWSRDQS